MSQWEFTISGRATYEPRPILHPFSLSKFVWTTQDISSLCFENDGLRIELETQEWMQQVQKRDLDRLQRITTHDAQSIAELEAENRALRRENAELRREMTHVAMKGREYEELTDSRETVPSSRRRDAA